MTLTRARGNGRARAATVRPMDSPELIIVGARLEPVAGPWLGSNADALAISGGRIAAVGTAAEVRALAGSATRVVRLAGQTVVPGFIDAHVHPIDGGMTSMECDLYSVIGADAYGPVISDYAAAHPERSWITGGGWSMSDFPGGTPRREALDALVPDRPVMLYNRDGHGVWVNSAALQLAGLDSATADPPNGRIERDPDGTPTGMLQEGAIDLVADHVPPTSHADQVAGLLEGQRQLHALGITGWQDAIVRPEGQAAYAAVQRSGRLTAGVRLALLWDDKRGLEQVDELVERREAAAADGLAAGSVKLFVDGIIENRTAVTVEPYLEPDGRPGDVTRHPHDRARRAERRPSPSSTGTGSSATSTRSATAGSGWPSTRSRPRGPRTAMEAIGTTSRTSSCSIPTTSAASPPSAPWPTCSRSGPWTRCRCATCASRCWGPIGRAGSTPSAACWTPERAWRAAATGRSPRPTRCSRWRSPSPGPTRMTATARRSSRRSD